MDRSFSEQDAYKVLEYNRNFISISDELFEKIQKLSIELMEVSNQISHTILA